MDEICEVDRLSNLPDCLIDHILLNLPTKDVVKTSVLSRRWRNLWRYVPVLDLIHHDFPHYNAFVTFVDRFLGFNSDSCLQNFKFKYDLAAEYMSDMHYLSLWINTVVELKVQHLQLLDGYCVKLRFGLPQTIYTCESLVSLSLQSVYVPCTDVVSLPSLKVIKLVLVKFCDDFTFEWLISHCPVLESLTIERSFVDKVGVLRVCSQSLLILTIVHHYYGDMEEDRVVEIDAPMLEYLGLIDYDTASFKINNPGSLLTVDTDIQFNLSRIKRFDSNDLQKRNMIRNFLVGISSVKVMSLSSFTLEVIYDYSRYEPLPLFRNLSFLQVEFRDYGWEMLPIFLESCPNLKSLVVGAMRNPGSERTDILSGPWCFLASLEYVEIERPLKGEAMEMKLVSYLLENSTILKKLTLCMDGSVKNEESAILRELLIMPRISSSCQVVVV